MVRKRLTGTARKLRRAMTDAEKRLWSRIRANQLDGHKFVRQFPIGPHVADFACRKVKLVVELDGGQHAESTTDVDRSRLIEAHGYMVIRFWNNDVLANTDGVLEEIKNHLRLTRG